MTDSNPPLPQESPNDSERSDHLDRAVGAQAEIEETFSTEKKKAKPRTFTSSAKFIQDGKGNLLPVEISTYTISAEAYAEKIESEVKKARKRLAQLLADGGKLDAANPLGCHPRLGPLAISHERLQHIIEHREKQMRGDPNQFGTLAEELDLIVQAAMCGSVLLEPNNSDGRRKDPQLWITYGNHQVTVAPFWVAPRHIPGQSPIWIVSGYRLGDPRKGHLATLQNTTTAQVIFKQVKLK